MSAPEHPHQSSPAPGSHYQPALGVVLILLALFVASAFLMLRSNSAAAPSPSTSSTTTTVRPSQATSHRVPRSKVVVQVANGTLTTGLAKNYSQQLMTLGWDALPPVNANRASATKVYYNPGYVWAARQIATEIKVGSSAVQPLNGLTPVPGASGDDVIVVLGPDVAIG